MSLFIRSNEPCQPLIAFPPKFKPDDTCNTAAGPEPDLLVVTTAPLLSASEPRARPPRWPVVKFALPLTFIAVVGERAPAATSVAPPATKTFGLPNEAPGLRV